MLYTGYQETYFLFSQLSSPLIPCSAFLFSALFTGVAHGTKQRCVCVFLSVCAFLCVSLLLRMCVSVCVLECVFVMYCINFHHDIVFMRPTDSTNHSLPNTLACTWTHTQMHRHIAKELRTNYFGEKAARCRNIPVLLLLFFLTCTHTRTHTVQYMHATHRDLNKPNHPYAVSVFLCIIHTDASTHTHI